MVRDGIVEMRIKLKAIGVPLLGLANVYCDNQGVVKNTSVPESTLSKEHNSINFHIVRKSAAAGVLRVGKEGTATNLADPLTKLVPYSRKQGSCWGRFCMIIECFFILFYFILIGITPVGTLWSDRYLVAGIAPRGPFKYRQVGGTRCSSITRTVP